MDEAATYFMFADRFGWTPDQVDELPAVLADRMLVIAQVRDEVQAEASRSKG